MNPLAGRWPVLSEVLVGHPKARADPADPEPHTAEPRAWFPDPGADGLEARRRLIEGGWGCRFGLGVLGAQVENRQSEGTLSGGRGADCRRNLVCEFKLSRCYKISYGCNVGLSSELGAIRESASPSLGRYESRRARAWGDTGVGVFELGAIRESACSSLGRYGSRRVRAWGDMGVGVFELGAIRESASLSLGRYQGRRFRLVCRDDAGSCDVRCAGAQRVPAEAGVPSRGCRRVGLRLRRARRGAPRCRSGDRRSKLAEPSGRLGVPLSAEAEDAG